MSHQCTHQPFATLFYFSNSKSILNALELLVELGAMDEETNELTDLGVCLSALSLEPREYSPQFEHLYYIIRYHFSYSITVSTN